MDGNQGTHSNDNPITCALSVPLATDSRSSEPQGNLTGPGSSQADDRSEDQSENLPDNVTTGLGSDQDVGSSDNQSAIVAENVSGDSQGSPKAVAASEQTEPGTDQELISRSEIKSEDLSDIHADKQGEFQIGTTAESKHTIMPISDNGSKLYNLLKSGTSGTEMADKVIDPISDGASEITPQDKVDGNQETLSTINNTSVPTNENVPVHPPGNHQDMVDVNWCNFKCKFCPKSFPDRKAWKFHLMDDHGILPYACRYCEETYEHKHDLKEHERFHKSSRYKNRIKIQSQEIIPPQSNENPDARSTEESSTKDNPCPIVDTVDSDHSHEKSEDQFASTESAEVSQPKSAEKKLISQAIADKSSKRKKKHRHKTKSDLLKTLKKSSLQKKKNVVVVSVLDVMASDAAKLRQPPKPSGGASGALLSIVDQIRTTTGKNEDNATENMKGNYRLRAARKRALLVDDDDELYPDSELYSHVKVKNKAFKRGSSAKGRKTYPCRICPRVLSSNKVKIYHERGHPYPNECKVCHRAFQNKRDLADHEDGHTTGSWMCRLCSEIFQDYPSYEVHQQVHQREDKANQSFSCQYCSKVMKSKKSLEVHMRVHTGERPYKCNFCDKSYRHYESWNYHESKHKGTLKQHVCQFCGKAFGGKYGLQVHERIHTGEKPYKCDHCNLAFSSNEKLKVHKDRVNGLAFVCQFCGKEFFTKANLNQHEMIHKGVKPHKCKVCEASFTSVTSLKYHTRTVHTGERYPCQFCNKQCKSKGQLTSHLRSHTDERPFKCNFCNKSFRNSNTLKTHEQGIHLGYRYICQICKKDFSQRTALRTHDKLVHQGIKWKDLVLQRKVNRERRLAIDAAKLGQAAVDVKFAPGVTPPSPGVVKTHTRLESDLPTQVHLPEQDSPEPVKPHPLKLYQQQLVIPLSLAVTEAPGPSEPPEMDPHLSQKPVPHSVSVHSALPMSMSGSDQSSVDVAYQLATLATSARHLLHVRHSQGHTEEGLQVHVPGVHPGDSSVVDVAFPQDGGAPMYQTL